MSEDPTVDFAELERPVAARWPPGAEYPVVDANEAAAVLAAALRTEFPGREEVRRG